MMSQPMKTILSLLLVGAMLLPMAACSQTDINNTDETTAGAGDAQPSAGTETAAAEEVQEDTLEAVIAALPDANYNGHTFTSYLRNWINATLFMRQGPDDEMTGEPINDALWTRDRAIENKYNVTLDYVVFDPTMDLYNTAAKIIQAGDDSIGVVYGNMNNESPSFLSNGITIDVNTIPEIQLDQPYWSRYNSDIEIAGKLMFPTGDITCRYAGAPYLMLFNKTELVNHGYELLYDTVREGKWTVDLMTSMLEGTYTDANGNGQVDIGDNYGFIYETGKGWAFYNSFGYRSITLNENNEAVLNILNENEVNAIGTITQIANNENVWVTSKTYEEVDMFKQNQAIFCDQTACNLALFTDMETDFGVIPMPKENEEQAAYYTFANDSCSTGINIPKSTQDLSRTGTLVNAIAAASRVSSMKAQYEVTLQYRQTRDEDSVEMLQLISEAARFDLAVIFKWGGIYATVNSCIQEDKPLVSSVKSMQKVIPKTAEKVVKKLLEDTNG